MQSASYTGSSGPGSSIGRRLCVLCLGKALQSKCFDAGQGVGWGCKID